MRGDEMNTPNFELLHEVLEYVREHPEQHDQDYFRQVTACGTVMCFAGWTCTLRGGEWLANTSHVLATEDDREEDVFTQLHDGPREVTHVADRARRLLGLSEDEAYKLFYWCSTFDRLEQAVKDLENARDHHRR